MITKIREQIVQLRKAGDYFNLPDHPIEETIMYVAAASMEKMLVVVEEVKRMRQSEYVPARINEALNNLEGI